MVTLNRWKEMVLILLEEWRHSVKALKQFHMNHTFDFELKKDLVNVFFFFALLAQNEGKWCYQSSRCVKACDLLYFFFFFYVESSSFKMYQKYQNLLFDRMSRTKRKHSRSKAELLFPEKVRTERLLCRSLESGTGLKGEYNNTQP